MFIAPNARFLEEENPDVNNIIYGNAGDDTIYGGAGVDRIYGGDGGDTIYGGAGDDIIRTGSYEEPNQPNNTGKIYYYGDNDTVHGGPGDDRIWTDHGDDIIYGDDGNDEITVDAGDQSPFGNRPVEVYGGDGDDTIIFHSQHPASNQLSPHIDAWGGEGADEFVYIGGPKTTANSGIIIVDIHDYDASEGDKLIIDDALLNDDTVHFRYRSSGSLEGYTFYLNSSANSVSQSAFRVVTTDGNLTASDFAVYSDTDTDFSNPLTVVEWV